MAQFPKVLLFDLARVFLFPKDDLYTGELNELHRNLSQNPSFHFDKYFFLDEAMLKYVETLNEKFELYIFTSGTIQYAPEIHHRLSQIFSRIYSASEMGLSKNDPHSYLKVCKLIGAEPSEILFIDDQKTNTDAAQKAGLMIHTYKDLNTLKKEIF